MSKVSSADYPKYSGSAVSIGNSTARTGVTDSVLTSSYDMSDPESAIYNYAMDTLASILPKLNTFDANTLSSIQAGVNAYRDSGIQAINEMYKPIIANLENDIVSRFGNLDNSIFTDNLNAIESKRADAVSSFAQDVLARRGQLESDELTKRYALAEFLNGIASNTYKNALNSLSAALGGSASLNNYNNDLYNAISALQSTNSRTNANAGSLISNLIGLSGNSGSSFFPTFFDL